MAAKHFDTPQNPIPAAVISVTFILIITVYISPPMFRMVVHHMDAFSQSVRRSCHDDDAMPRHCRHQFQLLSTPADDKKSCVAEPNVIFPFLLAMAMPRGHQNYQDFSAQSAVAAEKIANTVFGIYM